MIFPYIVHSSFCIIILASKDDVSSCSSKHGSMREPSRPGDEGDGPTISLVNKRPNTVAEIFGPPRVSDKEQIRASKELQDKPGVSLNKEKGGSNSSYKHIPISKNIQAESMSSAKG